MRALIVSRLYLSFPGKSLHVVRACKHVGAMAHTSSWLGADVAARISASAAIEGSLSRAICAKAVFPQSIRVNVATGIQSALLYASATWPSLSPS